MPVAKRLSSPDSLSGQEAGSRRRSAFGCHTRRSRLQGCGMRRLAYPCAAWRTHGRPKPSRRNAERAYTFATARDCRSRAQLRRRLSVESTDRWRPVARRIAPRYAGIPLRTRIVFAVPSRPKPPGDRRSRNKCPIGGASPGARQPEDRGGFGRGRFSPAMDSWMNFAGRGTDVGV